MSVLAVRSDVVEELHREVVGVEFYDFYPLGEHIVAAPGVCGGRPTIKYTRLDARHVVAMVRSGEAVATIASRHQIPQAAVTEALALADLYDYEASYA